MYARLFTLLSYSQLFSFVQKVTITIIAKQKSNVTLFLDVARSVADLTSKMEGAPNIFNEGDLVFAKIKFFPAWPARVSSSQWLVEHSVIENEFHRFPKFSRTIASKLCSSAISTKQW